MSAAPPGPHGRGRGSTSCRDRPPSHLVHSETLKADPLLALAVFNNPPDEEIAERLRSIRTIAVVGISEKPYRDSYGVAEYLDEAGYTIVPVNPHMEMWESHQCFPDLETAQRATRRVGKSIDMIDVFRRPSAVKSVVDQALGLKIPALWFQLGVIDWDEAHRAVDHHVWTVMDRCLAVMHRKLIGAPKGH
ncbi:MAG: CoA-binding protein [Euryarchaeota archaeon]|nr:CoA-binding protein [Euryarchaeota archaeon]